MLGLGRVDTDVPRHFFPTKNSRDGRVISAFDRRLGATAEEIVAIIDVFRCCSCPGTFPLMKPLRQQNTRPIISYVPRVEPAPPDHAVKMEGFKDVWLLRGKYVAFVLMGDRFQRSQAFSIPESAQRWAVQMRQEGEVGDESA